MEGSKGTKYIVRLVQELYKHTADSAVRWNDDGEFQVSTRISVAEKMNSDSSQAMDTALSLARSKLRRDRNANLQIMRLPPEIMSIIFRFVQNSIPLTEPDPEEPNGPLRFSYHWLALAHVCHHWRTISTSCATLWSTFDVTGEHDQPESDSVDVSIPQLFLTNSRATPLSVQIQVKNHRSHSWYLILEQLGRVRALRVYGSLDDKALEALADDTAPQLEQLAWHVSNEDDPDTLPLSFVIKCPRLTSLDLMGAVDFGTNTFRSLRQLHLTGQLLVEQKAMAAFHAFLASNSGIEDLYFTKMAVDLTFAGISKEQPSVGRGVALPRLRRLAFVDTLVGDIISMLTFLCVRERPLALSCEARRDNDEGIFEDLDDVADLLMYYPPPSTLR